MPANTFPQSIYNNFEKRKRRRSGRSGRSGRERTAATKDQSVVIRFQFISAHILFPRAIVSHRHQQLRVADRAQFRCATAASMCLAGCALVVAFDLSYLFTLENMPECQPCQIRAMICYERYSISEPFWDLTASRKRRLSRTEFHAVKTTLPKGIYILRLYSRPFSRPISQPMISHSNESPVTTYNL